MALQFEPSGAQIDGARDYQEDAFLITHLTDSDGNPSALIIVADGMGGHAAGNVASNMAVQAFNKHVSATYPGENPSDILHECVIKANASIKETIKETPALSGMGCTMVAAILEAGKLWWVSVGDSHLYLLRDKELIKKNADHSYGGFLDRMEMSGTPVEPEPGLSRNMLMSAVTGDDLEEIDVSQEPLELKAGDRVLLCSDGMDTLSKGKIIQFADWSETPKECAEALLNAVEDAAMPKQDNTTVVVVDVKEKAAPAAPEPKSAAATPEPEPFTKPSPADSRDEDRGRKKGGQGPLLGIAAMLIIAVAGGAYYLFQDQLPLPPLTGMAPDEPPAPEPVAEPEPPAAPADQTDTGAEPATPVSGPEPPPAAPEPTPVEVFRDTLAGGSPGPGMVWIPAGTFEMGSPGSSRYADERPRHTVSVDRFAISQHEITFAQYDRFARATGRERPGSGSLDRATHPVTNVTWDDAYNYAAWLSDQTGETYRLPSEAEWEYAAGAGDTSPFWWGFNEEQGKAHCFGCGSGLDPRQPTRVGQFEPNPFGLHDTTGNVAEWVQDCWHENYQGAPGDGSVWQGGDCSMRLARGGAYTSPMQSVRHAKRDRFVSDTDYDHIGIRVVREP